MKAQQKRIEEKKNSECHECGSGNLSERYNSHDGSLKGYRCNDCRNTQPKIRMVYGEHCTHCESLALRKMFDSNLWVMNKCMDCGTMD